MREGGVKGCRSQSAVGNSESAIVVNVVVL